MKKFLFSIATIACMALLFSSCEKEIVDNTTPISSDTVTITFNASSSLLGSKTYIDGNDVKWSDSGEVIRAFEVATPKAGDAVTTPRYSDEGVTGDGGATMTFGTTWPVKSTEEYTSFDYYAFYPNSAYQSYTSVSNVQINTPAAQTPTATSFDPAADLLIAKAKTSLTSQPSELTLQFARAVAVAKMTIKNLESTDPVTKITFSAKNGDTPVKLAGRTAYDLAGASLVSTYASSVAETSIVIDCSNISQTANTSAGAPVYFTCYPFALNSTTPGSFKVVIETATESFTKEVSVSSSKGLVLTAAQPSIFAVDMDNITGTAKAADLCYAYLDYADYAAAGGTGSYGNVTVNKVHGDSWVTYATTTGVSIGLGNISSSAPAKNSYIQLPIFVDDIKSVIVTLNEVTAGKALNLEDAANKTEASIASEATSEGVLTYTFDLTGGSYKTAYLRSSGFQAKVAKIEVYAGTDTRTPLAAPTNVAASLNVDDANVTNSIDVSWDAVDGAGGYVITLMDENSDLVIKKVACSPYTVTGLEYDMEYMIAVKAVPSDTYVNKESAETDAPSLVTTGTEVLAGTYYEKITDVASVTTGEYIIAAHVGSKYYALSNTFATQISGTEVTVSNNKISESDGDDYVVTITVNASGNISIFNGSKYLNCAASGTNFSVGDAASYHSIATATYGTFQIKHLSAARAIIYRTSTYNRFGNYSTSGVNGTEYYDVELFKKVDTRSDAGLAWDVTDPTATIGNGNVVTFTPPTLTNDNGVDVTYSSSDEEVATVDNTGYVEIVGAGQATISAIFAGDATYKPATVSYTVTVTDERTPYDTPTFSPVAGEVTSGTEVTISCLGADAIYYTTDGTTPNNQTSTLYDSPISVTSTVTIKAIAYKDGRKPSEVASATYTVAGVGAETLVYTLEPVATGGNGTPHNSYTAAATTTISSIEWSVMGNSYMVPWRIGGKSLTGEDRAIFSTTAISDNISKIVITHGAASSITVNSMTVIVSKNSDFTSPVSTLTPSFVDNDDVTVNRPDGKDWSNCYYKIVYNVSVSGTSNKFLEFTRAKFYTIN